MQSWERLACMSCPCPGILPQKIRILLKLGKTVSQTTAATSAVLCHLLTRKEEVLSSGKATCQHSAQGNLGSRGARAVL